MANIPRLKDYIQHLLTILPERFSADLKADDDDLPSCADAMELLSGTGD